MSDDIKSLKNKLKIIQPLLKKDNIKLDELKLEMQGELDLLETAKQHHERLLSQKEELLKSIKSGLDADVNISVNTINNNRRFFDEHESSLQEAEEELARRQKIVDELRNDILNKRLSILKLEKYRDRKDQSLFIEMDKDNMQLMDELWTQKLAMEKGYE